MHPHLPVQSHRSEKRVQMKFSVRAAGFAVAAFVLAVSAAWSGPLQAVEGSAAPVATYYTDHDGAATEVAEFSLNAAPAETPAPAGPAVGPTIEDARVQSLGLMADHLVALADATLPRPRSLGELVENYAGLAPQNGEEDCLASAVYFEARGEPIEGQLAVAEVVLNRTQSGRYPTTICEVVTQPWQFSFVRRGNIPAADRNSECWRRAVAIARIAETGASRMLPHNVLWYHADYVSPSWGRRLARNTKIGLHIFYS